MLWTHPGARVPSMHAPLDRLRLRPHSTTHGSASPGLDRTPAPLPPPPIPASHSSYSSPFRFLKSLSPSAVRAGDWCPEKTFVSSARIVCRSSPLMSPRPYPFGNHSNSNSKFKRSVLRKLGRVSRAHESEGTVPIPAAREKPPESPEQVHAGDADGSHLPYPESSDPEQVPFGTFAVHGSQTPGNPNGKNWRKGHGSVPSMGVIREARLEFEEEFNEDDLYESEDYLEEEEEDDNSVSTEFDTAEEYAFAERADDVHSNSESDSELESDLEDPSKEEEIDLALQGSLATDNESPEMSCQPTLDRIGVLKNGIRNQGLELTTSDVVQFYDHPWDEFQRVSVDSYLEGLSVVICAPTSSGKTLIAEAASIISLIRNQRLFYTTPLKALSNQKFRDFRKMYGEENVGLLTGDASINCDAPIIVMTTEILRNMLYSSIGSKDVDEIDTVDGDYNLSTVDGFADERLRNVRTVVLDEVHYLSDISRGTVWEETIIYCPRSIQLICLSATISNADEFAHWISQVHGPTELVSSSFRPVPLVWHFSTKYSLKRIFERDGITLNKKLLKDPREKIHQEIRLEHFFPERNKANFAKMNELKNMFLDHDQFNRRKQIPLIQDTLEQLIQNKMLPAIWFIFSRKKCDLALYYLKDFDMLSEAEKVLVDEKIEEFKKQNPDAIREDFLSSLRNGFASHHAGCLPAWKFFIEGLFQKGLIKVVFSTETLAAGINMPAKSTVISSLSKKINDYHSLISSNSILQMAGRAGRRGKDKIGHVIIVQNMFDRLEDCYRLLLNGSDPLTSQFTATYGMALNLLSRSTIGELLDEKNLSGSQSGPSGASQTSSIDTEKREMRRKKTIATAKALIEKSFANYLSNEISFRGKSELKKIQNQIVQLENECNNFSLDSIFEDCDEDLVSQYREKRRMLKIYKSEYQVLNSKLNRLHKTRINSILENLAEERNPLLSLNFSLDSDSKETLALYIGKVKLISTKENPKSNKKRIIFAVEDRYSDSHELPFTETSEGESWHAALTTGNFFCLISSSEIQNIFSFCDKISGVEAWEEKKTSFVLSEELKLFSGRNFEQVNENVFICGASMKVWPWSSILTNMDDLEDVPELEPISDDLKLLQFELEERKRRAMEANKSLKATVGYKIYTTALGQQKQREEKLKKLYSNEKKWSNRLAKMQPAGWKEFLNVVSLLKKYHAINSQTHALMPLGQIALNIRGENELLLASILYNPELASFEPHQLASALSSLVSDGIRPRMDSKADGMILYPPSLPVIQWLKSTRAFVEELERVQVQEGVVNIPCSFEEDYTGLVEGWAYGLTWKEITSEDHCSLDQGDVARLLRRTIDLLSQLSHLPHIDPSICTAAREASFSMDRPPISELFA